MSDIIKITSPLPVKNNVTPLIKKQAADGIFDPLNPNLVIKPDSKAAINQNESSQLNAFQTISKELLEPFLKGTGEQSNKIKNLIIMSGLFDLPSTDAPSTEIATNELSSTKSVENILKKLFCTPDEFLNKLVTKDKDATIFKGEIFDGLRTLTKLKNQPDLEAAIVSVLKHFDCNKNQNSSLKAILILSKRLPEHLFKADVKMVQEKLSKLETMTQQSNVNIKEIQNFLKNEYVPFMGEIVKKYQMNDKIRNNVMAIVHYIVRLEKGDQQKLEAAVPNLGSELNKLTNLSEDDITQIIKQISNINPDTSSNQEEIDIADVIVRALDRDSSEKLNVTAQVLLKDIIQSESPILQVIHFTIPIQYLGEKTYVEFFIDKSPKEKEGGASKGKTFDIFFTIQSDYYGTFEVDLTAVEKQINLSIKCPNELVDIVKDTKAKLKDIVQDQGYRLMNYEVETYVQAKSILQRFPGIVLREVGIDVRI